MSGSMARRGGMAAAALVSLGIAASPPARATDDGYANVFSSLLGSVGLIKTDPPPAIEYRERAPLVLPRDASLPKPAVGAARHSAAWPQDPDVLKQRRASEEAHAPHTLNPGTGDRGLLLTPDELDKGRVAATEPVRPNECGNDGKQCLVLRPDQLKAEAERFQAANPDKSDTLVAGKEPDREFLTQPPKGYMKPTKSVKAIAEGPEEKLDPGSPRYQQQLEALKKSQDQ
jgi:hypothetical protein